MVTEMYLRAHRPTVLAAYTFGCMAKNSGGPAAALKCLALPYTCGHAGRSDKPPESSTAPPRRANTIRLTTAGICLQEAFH